MAEVAAQIATLKSQRNAVQTNVKKEIKKIPDFFPRDGTANLDRAEASILKLRSYLEQHHHLSSDIASKLSANQDELDAECEAASEFQELILDSIAELTVSVDRNRRPVSVPIPTLPDANGVGSSASVQNFVVPGPTSVNEELSVKLPKLQINKFDGDPIKWEEFWDGFSSTIHENPKLSKVDKFKYLKTFLEGDALGMLSGYMLTNANYDTVIEALSQRFGNKDIAINAHFEAMLALPEASHSTSSLQHTYQSCETHIRSLVALGLSEDVFGKVFTPIILSKMPKFVRMEILRENRGEPWTLSNLRDLLRQEIHVREMSDRTVSLQQKPPTDKPQPQKSGQSSGSGPPKAKGGTTASLMASASNGGKNQQTKCAFCGEAHFSDECKKYPDFNARRERIKGACYKCLRKGHGSRDCKSKNRPCAHCQKYGHHRSLCAQKFGENRAREARSPEASFLVSSLNPKAPEFVPVHYASSRDGLARGNSHRAVLPTAVADVVGPGGTVRARLLFDTASSRTFVKSTVSKGVKAKTLGSEYLNIAGFGALRRHCAPYKKTLINILCSDGNMVPVEAFETPTISCSIPKIAVDCERFPVLKQVKLAEPQIKDSEEIGIDILVGCDYYYDFIGSVRLSVTPGLHLIESKLGFVLSGRIPCSHEDTKVSTLLLTANHHPGSEPLIDVSRYWDMEDIGIKDSTDQVDDEVAMQQFMSTVTMKNGRYSVKWPWKQDRQVLLDNFGLAAGQLKSLLRRLKSNPALLDNYDKQIKEQLMQGIIEPAPRDSNAAVYYLPHHAVVRPDKETTKVRIVYNASAKTKRDAYSLNDCLYRGPVILEDMCGMVIRFRFWLVALSSDIAKAFLQIDLQESERDVVRFLWVEDPAHGSSTGNVVAYRFCRVPFGVISSPFLLAATVRHHMLKANTEVSKDIAGNTYVDNYISGCRSTDEAVAYYREAKSLFEGCSMNLCAWATNDSLFHAQIAAEDRTPSASTKVLGLMWDTKADTLQCPAISVDLESPITKRQLLQGIAKLYDPCGFFSAVTVTGKMLMQQAWIAALGWDDPLPDSLQQQWQSYLIDLQEIPSVSLDRWYGSGSRTESLELHTFCDASKNAYACAVYLRIETASGAKTMLMFSKCKVRPLKGNITIPRLELLAAVIGVRITAFVAQQLRQPLTKKTLWSDSKCVLQWIPKRQVMPVFVENRLKEIRTHSDLSFRYVPTDKNPADLASRGCPLEMIKASTLWWTGPDFLRENEESWPDFKVEVDDSVDIEEMGDTSMVVNSQQYSPPEELCIKVNQFSAVRKLVNVLAWVLRFCNNARKHGVCKEASIAAKEYDLALHVLVKSCQGQHYGDLFQKKPQPRIVSQLQLFRDEDGIIRSQGRLFYAELDQHAKTPILLPPKDHLTKLIIEEAHRSVSHAKTSHTLAYLRSRYWIPQGRSVVRQVLHQCRVCRRYDAEPFVPPEQPPLPEFRVSRTAPFQVVGMDYLGPLHTKVSDGTEKVWICIFTCAAVRAIHLEVVNSQTTDDFLLCLRRFVARYGRPSMIVSDNAAQFKQADRTIQTWWKKLLESDETRNWANQNHLTWKFVTDRAPWMGGFYERLVGVVKNALKKTLERRLVSLIELQTVTAEIAAIVNTRPLTYVGEDVDDTALTPAHFLSPLKTDGFPSFEEADPDFTAAARDTRNVVLAWKKSQASLDDFWRQWQNQYLLSLRERGHQAAENASQFGDPKVGTVVLIKEPKLPRGQWRLGKILGLHSSFDGLTRSATVATQGRNLVRPLKLLIPLEYGGESGPESSRPVGSSNSDAPGSAPDPQRMGACPIVQPPTTPNIDIQSNGGYTNTRPRRVAASNSAAITRCQLDDE